MSDERLPYPTHGTRWGKDAPSGNEAEALRLLYTVNQIAQAAKVPVFAMQRPVEGGVVYASMHGSLAFKRIEGQPPERVVPQEPSGKRQLVWLPEGFVITPRTAGAPDGFGMPPTKDGKGTPGGPLTQVIINRYQNNQYPDALYRAQGRGGAFQVTCAPLFFMDWERDKRPRSLISTPPEKRSILGVGMEVRIGPGGGWQWQQQFDSKAQSRWTPNFKEKVAGGERWFCHRPTHVVGYLDKAQAVILSDTNLERESAGVPALSPPLRGTEGFLSSAILYQMDYAEQIEHDHPDYREGYRTFDDRYKGREGQSGASGENLFAAVGTGQGANLGHAAVEWWTKSPGHYANMIDLWGDDLWAIINSIPPEEHKLHATLDPAIRGGAKLPSLSTGTVSTASQIFHSREVWVYPAIPARKGDPNHCIGVDRNFGHSMRYFGWSRTFSDEDLDLGDPGSKKRVTSKDHVFLRGRAMRFRTKDEHRMIVLAATTAKREPSGPGKTTRQVIRLCVLEEFSSRDIDRGVIIYEGDAADFLRTRKEVGRYVMTAGQLDMSVPRFSESGDRLVFSYSELTVADTSQFNLLDSWPSQEPSGERLTRPPFDVSMSEAASYMWGDELHFMEWVCDRSTGFQEVATDSLQAQVEFTPIKVVLSSDDRWSTGSFKSYQSTVVGECKLFADYDGEEIVYLRIKVDCSHRYGDAAGGAAYALRQKGTLVFPDGTEIVYQDREISPYYVPMASTSVSGFFTHLCHLDILHPKLTVYLRHDIGFASQEVAGNPGAFEVRWTSTDSVWVGDKRVKDMGEVLKQPMLNAPDFAFFGQFPMAHKGCAFPYAFYSEYDWAASAAAGGTVNGEAVVFIEDSRGTVEFGATNLAPIAPFKVAVVSPTIYHGNSEDLSNGGFTDIAERSFGEAIVSAFNFLLVGPLFLNGITGFPGRSRNQRAEVVRYGDHHIVAGCVQRPFPVTEHVDPKPKYFWVSDLDLKDITGLDLDDNILPIGVL